jgi:hypothetical protein
MTNFEIKLPRKFESMDLEQRMKPIGAAMNDLQREQKRVLLYMNDLLGYAVLDEYSSPEAFVNQALGIINQHRLSDSIVNLGFSLFDRNTSFRDNKESCFRVDVFAYNADPTMDDPLLRVRVAHGGQLRNNTKLVLSGSDQRLMQRVYDRMAPMYR